MTIGNSEVEQRRRGDRAARNAARFRHSRRINFRDVDRLWFG